MERKVGFIGAGVMAQALVGRMIEAGVAEPNRLYAADPSEDRRQVIAGMLGENVFADNVELVTTCDVVVLSVKPHIVPVVAGQIKDALGDRLLVSIAAGVKLSALSRLFGTERTVRVMPNMPAQVGAGASAYCLGPEADRDDAAIVENILSAAGLCVRVNDEGLMDAVTGLSGSGPAYVYLTIEALRDGGVKMGLPRDVATRLAAQTVRGAANMVLETGRDPGVLRDQVTTPGGTTVEGLHVLADAGVRKAFMDAVGAATEKSRRLAGDD